MTSRKLSVSKYFRCQADPCIQGSVERSAQHLHYLLDLACD